MIKNHPITLVFPDGREVTLPVRQDAFIYDAAAEAGIELPHTCLQGWCLSCAARVLQGPTACVDDTAALRYFPDDAKEGFVLLCSGRPRTACRLATHQARAMKEDRRRRGRPAPGDRT